MIKKLLKDNNVNLFTVSGKYNLNNYDDELMYNILSSIAKRENSQRVRRSSAGRLLAVKSGKHSGGIYRMDIRKMKIKN